MLEKVARHFTSSGCAPTFSITATTRCVDAANAERDGWILVEDSRGTAGFIPADYARPSRATGNSIESASATTVATPAPPPAAAPAAVTASPTTFAQLSPPTVYPSQSATRLSSPATATTVADVPITSSGGGGGDGSRLSVLDPLAIARMTAPLAAGSYSGGTDYASARGAGVPPSSSAASDEYAHLFAAHEEWFKSAMTKRQEVRHRPLPAHATNGLRVAVCPPLPHPRRSTAAGVSLASV